MTWPRRGSERAIALAKRRCRARAGALRAPIHIDRHLLNYDLPWNPMRLVPRSRRIDRIGSPHAEVFVRCVFPDRQLDDLLGLEERLQRKIKQAAASAGIGSVGL